MPTRMTYIRRRVAVASLLVVFAWVGAQVAPALAPPAVVPWSPWLDPKVPETSIVSAETVFPTDNQLSVSLTDFVCPDAVALAHSLGWRTEDLDELDYVIWRESRCLPDVHYTKDPNGGSHGLMQINGYWCQPSRYYPNGYLQTQNVLATCENLYVPTINLIAGLEIFNYSSVHNDNGWQPWAMRKDFCEDVPRRCGASVIVGG
jgi:hypothetical protein